MGALLIQAVAATALLAPATAGGANVPRYMDRSDAKRFARDYWENDRGLYSPCRHLGLKFHRMSERGVLGYVARIGHGCTIHLNRRENWFWSKLCTTVTHEYGHLLGRKHTWALGSVMYPGWPNPEWGKRFHSCDFTYDDPEEAEPEPELDEDYCDEYDPDCLGESEDGDF